MRLLLSSLVLALAAFITANPAYAAEPVQTGRFSNTAISGYDAVAYFRDGKPVKGVKAFSTSYQGAQWRFSSADNLAAFEADPAAYAPQYGGYCAWAVAQDYTAPGNPKNWAIVDGRLYLNYNDDIQSRWQKDIPGFIAKGNANWPNVLKEGVLE